MISTVKIATSIRSGNKARNIILLDTAHFHIETNHSYFQIWDSKTEADYVLLSSVGRASGDLLNFKTLCKKSMLLSVGVLIIFEIKNNEISYFLKKQFCWTQVSLWYY